MELILLLSSLGIAGVIWLVSKQLEKKQIQKNAIKNSENDFIDEEED